MESEADNSNYPSSAEEERPRTFFNEVLVMSGQQIRTHKTADRAT